MALGPARCDRHAGPGLVFVLCGPSGVGKGTIVKRVFSRVQGLVRVRSYTTRPQRAGEDCTEYVFVRHEAFVALERQGDMIVGGRSYWGCLYGVRQSELCVATHAADIALIEADVATVGRLKDLLPQVKSLFIAPPSLSELRRRLLARGRDGAAEVDARVEEAERILAAADSGCIDARVINGDIDECARQCLDVLTRLRHGPSRGRRPPQPDRRECTDRGDCR